MIAVRRETLGERIRRVRLERGLSQRALVDSGLSNSYVSRIEKGERRPSYEALIALGDKLRVTALSLLTGDPHGVCPFCGRGPERL